MRVIEDTRARSAYLMLVLAVVLAGDALRFTFGWWAWAVLAAVLVGASVVLLVAHRERWRLGALPYQLIAFMVLATVSLAWSAYPAASALGLVTTWATVIAGVAVAVAFPWDQLLRGLGIVLRAILALSLVFELFVSVVVRAPVLPLFTQPGVDYSIYNTIPKMLYWSRNELFQVFDEGRIQGIVGNSNTLGFLSLLAVIIFSIQLVDRTVNRGRAIAWIVVAFVVLAFTRSATVTVALVVVIAAGGALLVVRRASSPRARALVYGGLGAGVIAVGTLGWVLRDPILGLLGKSSDLTGRLGIWQAVIELGQQRPVAGWGWVSFWVPWAAPFDELAFRNGVRQLQAHNAWIDIWFQVGIIGLIVFGALVVSAGIRSWFFAVDRRQTVPGEPAPYSAITLLPVLVLTALLVQSVAESRLLDEYGLALLVIIAVKTTIPDASAKALSP
ncbi:MAG: O-antigen ligase family protein [Rhodoglobus sp.]